MKINIYIPNIKCKKYNISLHKTSSAQRKIPCITTRTLNTPSKTPNTPTLFSRIFALWITKIDKYEVWLCFIKPYMPFLHICPSNPFLKSGKAYFKLFKDKDFEKKLIIVYFKIYVGVWLRGVFPTYPTDKRPPSNISWPQNHTSSWNTLTKAENT